MIDIQEQKKIRKRNLLIAAALTLLAAAAILLSANGKQFFRVVKTETVKTDAGTYSIKTVRFPEIRATENGAATQEKVYCTDGENLYLVCTDFWVGSNEIYQYRIVQWPLKNGKAPKVLATFDGETEPIVDLQISSDRLFWYTTRETVRTFWEYDLEAATCRAIYRAEADRNHPACTVCEEFFVWSQARIAEGVLFYDFFCYDFATGEVWEIEEGKEQNRSYFLVSSDGVVAWLEPAEVWKTRVFYDLAERTVIARQEAKGSGSAPYQVLSGDYVIRI